MESHMKARLARIAGLVLAGTLVVSTAAIDQKSKNTDADTSATVASGVTSALSGSLSDATMGVAGVSGMDVARTAQGQEVVEEGTESAEAGVDASTSSAAAGVSAELADAATVASQAQDELTETESTEEQTESTEQDAAQQAASAYGYTNLGVANVEGNLNVRAAAGTDADVVGKMPNNAGCEILGVEGEWTQIKSGSVEGYVKSEYLLTGDAALARADEVKQTLATVTTTTLYVREQPNTDCAIVTMMPQGEELEVLEVLDGWVKINVDSDEGYVSSDYVEISTELLKAMTMTEIRYGQGVSDVRVSLVQYATQFVGNPYVWGGTSLTRGADCSGFVMSVFANYGISLPHSSRAQANCGTKISASDAQPGDLVFQRGPEAGSDNHVGILCGKTDSGDWIAVHCSSSKNGVTVGEAYSASFRYIRQPAFYSDTAVTESGSENAENTTTEDGTNNILTDVVKSTALKDALSSNDTLSDNLLEDFKNNSLQEDEDEDEIEDLTLDPESIDDAVETFDDAEALELEN